VGYGRNMLFVYRESVRNVFRSDKYFTSYARDERMNARRSSCKVFDIVIRFKYNWNVARNFSKDVPISNLMKIHSVVLELLLVDRNGDANKRIHANLPSEIA
jgi:hypothetical protein